MDLVLAYHKGGRNVAIDIGCGTGQVRISPMPSLPMADQLIVPSPFLFRINRTLIYAIRVC